MFDALETAVEGLEIPVDGAALQHVLAIRDRLDARIAEAVGAFDRAELWDMDGASSMATWLRHHAGREHGAANRLAVQARKLRHLPALREAFHEGALCGGQVDIVLANVPMRHLDRFADHESALLEPLAALDADRLRTAMVDWRTKADAVAESCPDAEHENQLYLATTIAGRGELRGSLDADLTALVTTALRLAERRDFDLTPAERRAESLETVCRHFLDHQRDLPAGRHRPHLTVVVALEELLEEAGGRYPDTGGVPSPAELGALSCDAALHRLVVEGRSTILDHGRAKRVVPPDLFQALVARDHGCRFPGCGRPAAWTDAHHVVHWKHGGATAVGNLVLLCRRHHRRLHRPGHEAKLLPDGTFEVTHPDGRTERTTPPGPLAERFFRRFGGS